jgi:hypothetical protein
MFKNIDFDELEDFLPIILPIVGLEGKIDMDCNLITTNLGIEPTDIWYQPNKKLHHIPGIVQSRWAYQFSKIDCLCIEDALDKVFSLFLPKQNILSNLKNNGIITRSFIYFQIYITNRSPVIYLSLQNINQLHLLQTTFTIDIFPIDKLESYEKNLSRQSWKLNENGYNIWIISDSNCINKK